MFQVLYDKQLKGLGPKGHSGIHLDFGIILFLIFK